MIRRVLTAVATPAMTLLIVVLPATGAGAQAVGGPPAITLNEPQVNGANVTIAGVAVSATALEPISNVVITVTPRSGGDPVSCQGCGADRGQTATFAFQFAQLRYNGPYDVTVDATADAVLEDTTATETTSFRIEVPPAPPAGVQAVANPDGTVSVSWSRNSEPDLAGYQVLRRDPAAPSFKTVAPAVAQPPDGARVRWTDTTAAAVGGRLEYKVAAIRPDGDGALSDRTTSTSTTASVSLPVPGGAPGTPGGGAAGPVLSPGSGAPNLDSFRSVVGESGGGSAFTEPDGTFSENLPFGARRERAAPRGSADDAVVLGNTTNRRAILLPIAAGLFLCVSAVHLRLFSQRVLEAPMEG